MASTKEPSSLCKDIDIRYYALSWKLNMVSKVTFEVALSYIHLRI